jgi:hypothetical protein
MAQAAGEMQDAATDVVKQAARVASSALKRKKR